MGRGMKLGKIEKVLPKNANGNVKGKTRNEERKSCGDEIGDSRKVLVNNKWWKIMTIYSKEM
jgi:hypothetical protein